MVRLLRIIVAMEDEDERWCCDVFYRDMGGEGGKEGDGNKSAWG